MPMTAQHPLAAWVNLGMGLFKLFKMVKKPVVLGIRYAGLVQHIIAVIVLIQRFPKRSHLLFDVCHSATNQARESDNCLRSNSRIR